MSKRPQVEGRCLRRDVSVGFKILALDEINVGLFKISFSAETYLISPTVVPFGANLTKFEPILPDLN